VHILFFARERGYSIRPICLGRRVGDDGTVQRLRHGYTNRTRIVDGHVEKTYEGPRRFANARRELACVSALGTQLPVAAVIEADLSIPRLALSLVPGAHGQDLIDDGHAGPVLRLVGAALHTLQRVPVGTVPGLLGEGAVIVHGDFGPQNMLFALNERRVTGILDWELAHVGDPVEDLAWAEWLIRMHHPRAIDTLDELFAGAGERPTWRMRHDAMLHQVRGLLSYCEATDQLSDWRRRLDLTERWSAE
jgi:tRNA A-37 threonylcarbamoyl transferase component Bud32